MTCKIICNSNSYLYVGDDFHTPRVVRKITSLYYKVKLCTSNPLKGESHLALDNDMLVFWRKKKIKVAERMEINRSRREKARGIAEEAEMRRKTFSQLFRNTFQLEKMFCSKIKGLMWVWNEHWISRCFFRITK